MSIKTKKNLFWGFVLAVSVAVLAMVAAPKAIAALTATGGEINNVQTEKSATGKDCGLKKGEGACDITEEEDTCEGTN